MNYKELVARLRETYPATYCFTDKPHIAIRAADVIEALEMEVEVDNRNLEQLSDEVNALRKQLAVVKQAQQDRSEWKKNALFYNDLYSETKAQLAADQGQKPVAEFRDGLFGCGVYLLGGLGVTPPPAGTKLYTIPQQAQPEPSKIEPWQPMKTAPKDGVAVMVLLEGSDIPHAAQWLNGVDDAHATVETVGAGWHLTWDGSPVSEYSGPRCWMYCPDEPYDKFAQQTAPRFAKTYCSQCGREFGAGNYGFSHCEDHAKQAQPERGPLTFEQIDEIWVEHGLDHCGAYAFARAIEAAHGIKGGQHD